MERTRSRRIWWLGAALAVLLVAAVAGAVFQPWRLLYDETVVEAVPTAGPVAESAPAAPSASPPPAAPTGPVELASGALISHEHPTTGTARVLQLEDGARVLVLDGLDTVNGPDLHVWLTDQPVIEGTDGWFVFDDGAWTSLGPLRGNVGTQQYAIPDGVDLSQVTSVSIWCERFAASFGAAPLDLA